jgi:hypothetical protein
MYTHPTEGAGRRAATPREACSLIRFTTRASSRSCRGEDDVGCAPVRRRMRSGARWGKGRSTRTRSGTEHERPVCAARVRAAPFALAEGESERGAAGVGWVRSVRWAATCSGGLKSHWCSDGEHHIQKGVPDSEVDRPVQGQTPPEDAASHPASHGGADLRAQSCDSRMGQYYKRAHVRRLFNQLDRWIERRLWSHRYRRWRCAGRKILPTRRLRGEMGLVSLIGLIPSLAPRQEAALS